MIEGWNERDFSYADAGRGVVLMTVRSIPTRGVCHVAHPCPAIIRAGGELPACSTCEIEFDGNRQLHFIGHVRRDSRQRLRALERIECGLIEIIGA